VEPLPASRDRAVSHLKSKLGSVPLSVRQRHFLSEALWSLSFQSAASIDRILTIIHLHGSFIAVAEAMSVSSASEGYGIFEVVIGPMGDEDVFDSFLMSMRAGSMPPKAFLASENLTDLTRKNKHMHIEHHHNLQLDLSPQGVVNSTSSCGPFLALSYVCENVEGMPWSKIMERCKPVSPTFPNIARPVQNNPRRQASTFSTGLPLPKKRKASSR
jgi:hypothetical protein